VPILLGLFGATLDFARVNEMRVMLEGSTRDAAEQAAMSSLSESEAATQARRTVCLQVQQSETCDSPSVALVSYSRSDTAHGASARQPLVSVTVQSSMPFQTLFPYPFLTDQGRTTLTARSSFAVLQNR
jgi:hypothetical protein